MEEIVKYYEERREKLYKTGFEDGELLGSLKSEVENRANEDEGVAEHG